MKKLLILLLLLPSLAWGGDLGQDYARMNPYILGGGASAAAACTVDTDSALYEGVATGTTLASGSVYNATKFSIGSASTITQYVARGCDDNADTGNINMSIYSHNAGDDKPDVEIANTKVTVAASAIPNCGSLENTVFTLAATKSLPAGTYWVVKYTSESASQGSVYHTSSGARACYGSGAWDCTADATYDMNVMGCTP